MEKPYILDAIRRTAEENGGEPLGFSRFSRVSGIRKHDWFPHLWLRWGDAQTEAGFARRQFQTAFPDTLLIDKYIALVRELGALPIYGDLVRKRSSDPEFPSPKVFERLGSKSELAQKAIHYAAARPGYEDVVAICSAYAPQARVALSSGQTKVPETGVVYLYKCRWGRGQVYKIGRTNASGRREYELTIQLPEPGTVIHKIRTDDPVGIEAYWHQRFADKKKNGEWFELNAPDIAAFKRRTFM